MSSSSQTTRLVDPLGASKLVVQTCVDCRKLMPVGVWIVQNLLGEPIHYHDALCNREISKLPIDAEGILLLLKHLSEGDNWSKLNLTKIWENLDLSEYLSYGDPMGLHDRLVLVNRLFPEVVLFSPEQMIGSNGELLMPSIHRCLLRMDGQWVTQRLARLAVLHDSMQTEDFFVSAIPYNISKIFNLDDPKYTDLQYFDGSFQDVRGFVDMRQFPEYVAIHRLAQLARMGDEIANLVIRSVANTAKSVHIKSIASFLQRGHVFDENARGDAFLGYMLLNPDGSQLNQTNFASYVTEYLRAP